MDSENKIWIYTGGIIQERLKSAEKYMTNKNNECSIIKRYVARNINTWDVF